MKSVQIVASHEQKWWDEWVTRSSHATFLQSWAWGEFQQALGQKIWRVKIDDQGVALIVQRALPLGLNWLYVPGGPIFSDHKPMSSVWPEWQSFITELARKERSLFVRIDPFIAEQDFRQRFQDSGWQKSSQDVQPRETIVSDLNMSVEQLRAYFHPKTRYNVNLAERKGVRVRFVRSKDEVEKFIQLSQQVSARSPFRYHPAAYYQKMLEVLGRHRMIELGVAEYKSQVLAAHILVYFGGQATYLHGASSSQDRQVMAPQFLHWQSMLRAKELGVSLFDWWGVAPADAPMTHPWAGITRLKTGFGGTRRRYIGAYDLIVRPQTYRLYKVARQLKNIL